MKPYSNYQKGTPTQDAEKLPAGGYVIKILKAEEAVYPGGGSSLKLSFDIAEGEYKDFYKKNYDMQMEPKKWKGIYSFSIPNERTEERYRKAFESRIACITESNPGYEWDWNEAGLKNKTVGAVFGNQEYDFNGSHGFFTKCFGLREAQAIREGRFKTPKDRLLQQERKEYGDGNFMPVNDSAEDDDMPF